ncbi:hypothetical protein Lal_00009710 [Lupinus albus]|nr:hypothetical protein Lal_00009710 [Lupinus albus]
MEDGSTKKGFAQDFMLPDVATFSFMGKGPKYANLDRKEVKFKSSKSDTQVQLIPVSDIKSLLYTNEETQEQFQLDKRLVKEINKDQELESEGKVLMLPLMEKGLINLYGYRSMMCKADFGNNYSAASNGNENDCQLTYVMVYLSKPDDTVAIAPVDYPSLSPLDLFNLKTLYKKFYTAYEMVGADCPEFLKKVDEARQNDYFSNKTFKEKKRATDDERKAALKVNFKPLADRVLIEPIAAETKTASGIIIPDTAKEKPQEGTVVAVGPGKKDEPTTVQVGDKVLYGKYSGSELKLEGKDYLIVKEGDLLGIIG